MGMSAPFFHLETDNDTGVDLAAALGYRPQSVFTDHFTGWYWHELTPRGLDPRTWLGHGRPLQVVVAIDPAAGTVEIHPGADDVASWEPAEHPDVVPVRALEQLAAALERERSRARARCGWCRGCAQYTYTGEHHLCMRCNLREFSILL